MSEKLTPEERQTRDVYDEHALDYIRIWGAKRESSDVSDKRMSKFKELLPGGRVLEIGAGGAGRIAGWLVANGYDYIGTDFSSGMLEEARKNNPGVRFDQISVYDLDFDKSFDGFWCSAVLVHIPKNRLDEALIAIHKNMKEAAYGVITIKEGARETVEEDGRFNAYWSDEDFSQHLSDNGYRIIKCNPSRGQGIKWLTYIVRTEKDEDGNRKRRSGH